MAGVTNIQWTDRSSNPIRARRKDGLHRVPGHYCEMIAPECANCYASKWQPRYHMPTFGGVRKLPALPVFDERGLVSVTDDVEVYLDQAELHRLLRSRAIAGKRIFMCDMTDLFGRWVPFEWVDRLMAVGALRPDVTLQILTKRPERLAEYMRALEALGDVRSIRDRIELAARDLPTKPGQFSERQWRWNWPLPNVWLGTSVGTQKTADAWIPHLLKCGAAVRFLSCEPLLEPLDIVSTWQQIVSDASARQQICPPPKPCDTETAIATLHHVLHWVIVGGESGPVSKVRPCNVDWIRQIIRQCRAAGVPCFVKQLGRLAFDPSDRSSEICQFDTFQTWVNKAASWLGGVSGGGKRYKSREKGFACVDARGRICRIGGDFMRARDDQAFPVRAVRMMQLKDSHGGDWSEWPADLRVREFPQLPGAEVAR